MKSKFTWIITLFMAFFIQFSFAQEKTIIGKVTSVEDGLPIPSVNVVVQGTNRGTLTDFDGNFSIKAAQGEKLVLSSVTMKTQVITVGASSTVAVKMESDTQLQEVVVQGYRNTTRVKSNVASTTVTAKTIEGRPNASFIQTLQSQIPGLNITTGSGQPGSNSTVILRGLGSVNGNVEPLYIIDGIPLNSDSFRSINPNDIESVSVLKDAGATSIYGNRGANGVIVVNTKRGGFESELKIKYSSVSGFTELQSNKYHMMNARQLLSLEKGYGSGFGTTLSNEEINNWGVDTNWKDQIFRTGISQSHTLNLTSGSKTLSSFTSLGYFDQEGIVKGTGLKRFTFRNNLNGKSTNNKFNYSTSLTINYSQRNEANNLGTGNVNINPIIAANNGSPYLDPNLYQNGKQLYDLYNDGIGDIYGRAGTLFYSPLMLLDITKTNTNRTNEIKMIGSVQGSYKLTDDLTLSSSLGSDFTEAMGLRVQDPYSFNSYLFQNADNEILGFQNESIAREFHVNVNTRLNYNKTFAEKHNIDVSIYTEYYKSHLKSFQYTQNGLDGKVFVPGAGTGFVPHNPDPNGDPGPGFYVPQVGAGIAEAGLFSYFASADYDYNAKYGIGATIRRDASYRFAETNRWGTFWSVSGRWNIDQEAFMEGSVFDMLKLRASYGTAGNQNISGQSIFNLPNASRTLYGNGLAYNGSTGYFLTQLGNPDLKWETVEQANIGLDFSMFTQRLRGNLDVYQKTTKDLYQSTPISSINGTSAINANNGSLRNKGVELLLSYDVIANQDFRLTVSGNGSYNKNELLSIPDGDGLSWDGSSLVANKVGGPLNQFYVIRYAGVNPATGNMLFLDKDGVTTETPNNNDRVFTGKSNIPKYQGGFGFDANYKGFFLTTQFSFVADVYRYDYDLEGIQDASDIGTFNKSTDLYRSWTPDNRVTDMPSLYMTNKGYDANSDRYIKDASYVRLRYISLGYDVPKRFLDKTFISNLKAYVQAENLVTWTKWRGWDAESPRGNDQYQYPTPRILSFGLELEF